MELRRAMSVVLVNAGRSRWRRRAILASSVTCLMLFLVISMQSSTFDMRVRQRENHIQSINSTKVSVSAETIAESEPAKFVVILSYQRCGSTWMGNVFNSNPEAFFVFEPLDSLYSSLYGTRSGWNVPADITSFSNGTERRPPEREVSAVATFLQLLLTCEFKSLPTETLLHHFWNNFRGEQKATTPYVSCLNRNRFTQPRIFQGSDPSRFCGARFGVMPPERLEHCYRLLHDNDSLSTVDEPTKDVFVSYKSRMAESRKQVDQKCVPKLQDICERLPLRATKVVRATMQSMEPLLRSVPSLRVIHLTRDPRAVGLSRSEYHDSGRSIYTKSIKSFKARVVAEATFYCRQVAADIRARRRLETIFPGRLMSVSYESATVDPVGRTRDIYRFLGLEAPPQTLKAMKRLAAKGERKLNAKQLAVRWRSALSPEQAHAIEQLCAEYYALNQDSVLTDELDELDADGDGMNDDDYIGLDDPATLQSDSLLQWLKQL